MSAVGTLPTMQYVLVTGPTRAGDAWLAAGAEWGAMTSARFTTSIVRQRGSRLKPICRARKGCARARRSIQDERGVATVSRFGQRSGPSRSRRVG